MYVPVDAVNLVSVDLMTPPLVSTSIYEDENSLILFKQGKFVCSLLCYLYNEPFKLPMGRSSGWLTSLTIFILKLPILFLPFLM